MELIGDLPRGNCANCGKEIPLRDTRDMRARYCGRICASLRTFKSRYRGTNAGPSDRPQFNEKGEKV